MRIPYVTLSLQWLFRDSVNNAINITNLPNPTYDMTLSYVHTPNQRTLD